jgi:hypothetical protein
VLSVDTAEIGLKVLLANGGQVRSRNGKLILRIPYQEPVAPAKLEQIHWKTGRKTSPSRTTRIDGRFLLIWSGNSGTSGTRCS